MYSVDIETNAHEFAVFSHKLEARARTRTILTTTTLYATIAVELRTHGIGLVFKVFWIGVRSVSVYPVGFIFIEHVDRYDHR
jgi:hypothetical protein